ncbi:unnamed protein product [Owenia fusiformis]|uniref:Uncharacterized protein n=1 Tax=Owenia fusiformis TaxID=6347 RepID=A0A8J1TYZ8_OWEFU|nr:unnamed protein product [Owenia fusiformis]
MSQVDVLTLNIADDVLKEYSLHFVELHGMHIRLQALVLLLTILFCKGVKQEKRHKTFLRQRHMTKMNERLSLQDTPKHRHHSHNIDMDINTDTSPIDVTHNKRDTSRRQNQNTPQKSNLKRKTSRLLKFLEPHSVPIGIRESYEWTQMDEVVIEQKKTFHTYCT